jgi:hypothetical protein
MIQSLRLTNKSILISVCKSNKSLQEDFLSPPSNDASQAIPMVKTQKAQKAQKWGLVFCNRVVAKIDPGLRQTASHKEPRIAWNFAQHRNYLS